MRKRNASQIIAMALVLAAPCIALADKKKVNKDTPTESISLNYTKPGYTYTSTRRRTNHLEPKFGINGESAIKAQGATGMTSNPVHNDPYKNFKFRSQ
jgi:hypothetical protein